MIAAVFYLFAYYIICVFAMHLLNVRQEIRLMCKDIKLHHIIAICTILGICISIIVISTGRNHYVYFWDYAGYWKSSIDRMNYCWNNSFKDSFIQLIQSINNDDYNIFLSSVVALPLKIFGYTFRRFVIINCILFLIPSYLVVGLIASNLTKVINKKIYSFIFSLLIATLFTSNYYAAFSGYIDVGYLLPMAVAMYALFSYDAKKINVLSNISISLMLVLIWVCRRYAVYFIIGYVVAMAISLIVKYVENRDHRYLLYAIGNYLMIGILSFGILIIFFKQFLIRTWNSNYGEMYSAYDAPLSHKFYSLSLSFGYISLAALGIVGICVFLYKSCVREYVLCLVTILLEVIVFWQTQDMGVHHRMLLNIPIIMIEVLPVIILFSSEEKAIKCKVLKISGLCMIVINLLNFVEAFTPEKFYIDNHQVLSEKYHPLVRNDINSLYELADTLNALTEENDGKVYVAASGVILNADILSKLDMPYTAVYTNNIIFSPSVDLRDGFNRDFLFANYIVTTDPVQTHLDSGQEIVKYIASTVVDAGTPIGKHYTFIYEVELDNGVIAKVYARQSGYLEQDLQEMRDYFDSIYPDYKEMFSERIYL